MSYAKMFPGRDKMKQGITIIAPKNWQKSSAIQEKSIILPEGNIIDTFQ